MLFKEKKYRFALALIAFISLMSFGCDKQDRHNEDSVLRAYQLIDEQRTDEAIELLETELNKNPNSNEYKSVLASAYAHKAGIKIQKLVPVINQADCLNKLKEKSSEVDKKESFSNRLNKMAIDASSLFVKLSNVMEAYASVPVLTADQATYLRHAIYLLTSIGKGLTQDDVLYRAVLEIILFKYILSENLIGEFTESVVVDEAKCRIDIGNLNETLINLGKLLIDIYNDLGFVDPKRADDMRKLSEETSDTVSNLTIATTTIAVLDEASTMFLKQAIIQQGFGKIIKCNGK